VQPGVRRRSARPRNRATDPSGRSPRKAPPAKGAQLAGEASSGEDVSGGRSQRMLRSIASGRLHIDDDEDAFQAGAKRDCGSDIT